MEAPPGPPLKANSGVGLGVAAEGGDDGDIERDGAPGGGGAVFEDFERAALGAGGGDLARAGLQLDAGRGRGGIDEEQSEGEETADGYRHGE